MNCFVSNSSESNRLNLSDFPLSESRKELWQSLPLGIFCSFGLERTSSGFDPTWLLSSFLVCELLELATSGLEAFALCFFWFWIRFQSANRFFRSSNAFSTASANLLES